HSHQQAPARRTAAPARRRAAELDGEQAARARILATASRARILEPALVRELIRERQERGIDKYDEVWDGVYVMPPLANNPHQGLGADRPVCLCQRGTREGRGRVFPGANVGDRRSGWDHNFRAPDVVVVLNDSRAVDCTTHWMGGPDFLI